MHEVWHLRRHSTCIVTCVSTTLVDAAHPYVVCMYNIHCTYSTHTHALQMARPTAKDVRLCLQIFVNFFLAVSPPCDARDAQADGWMISKKSSILSEGRALEHGHFHPSSNGYSISTGSFTLQEVAVGPFVVPPCPWPQPRAAGKGTVAQAV